MRDIVRAIKAFIAVVVSIFRPVYDKFIDGVKTWWNLIVLGALSTAGDILTAAAPLLAPIAGAFRDAIATGGGPILATLKPGFVSLANSVLAETSSGVTGAGLSTPDNAADLAAAAFATAFANGLASAGVAALFEAAFPEKLNTLDGLAPLLAKMAGFDEVAGSVLKPLYENAFGKSLEYKYRSLFKPELPDEADAITWHARRLLTDDQLRTIFGFSGLKPEYETPFVESAYRAIQPRMFATLLLDQPFPTAQVQSAMEFAGLRPDDVTFLLGALEVNSTKNVRQQYLAAAVRSTELGTMTPAELDGVLTSLNFSDDAKSWVQLTVATRKLEQLAELYRKSISEAYRYGQITDDQYVPALEAIGIGAADAQAHYAIDSIALRGRESAAFARAEAKLEASRTRAASSAALASYRSGTIDDVALLAALIAAGVDPAVAAFQVTVAVERKQGHLVFVYGLELSRHDALVLKENVSAVEAQYKKQLIDDAQAAAALSQLGIPERNATPLLATWAALKTKPTTTGEKLPR
jgi:hypothetical protein